jgi:hypothetical protein
MAPARRAVRAMERGVRAASIATVTKVKKLVMRREMGIASVQVRRIRDPVRATPHGPSLLLRCCSPQRTAGRLDRPLAETHGHLPVARRG